MILSLHSLTFFEKVEAYSCHDQLFKGAFSKIMLASIIGSLHVTKKLDLRRFATNRNGILYVRRPMLQRLWIPTSSLPFSAHPTATTMLNFLEKIQVGRTSRLAVARAATIIVDQYQHDLCEMGIVRNPYLFQGTLSVCIKDAMTAEEYVLRVFVHPEQLPSEMSTKGISAHSTGPI